MMMTIDRDGRYHVGMLTLNYGRTGRRSYRKAILIAVTMLAIAAAYAGTWLRLARTRHDEIINCEPNTVYGRDTLIEPGPWSRDRPVLRIIFTPAFAVDHHLRPSYWIVPRDMSGVLMINITD